MKITAKRAIKILFRILVYPIYVVFIIVATLFKSDRCFSTFSQTLSLFPGKLGVYLRAAFYHLACPHTSEEISIGFLTVLSHRNTSIARGVYIGPQCNIGMCSIGENTLLGSGVHILSGSRQHEFRDIHRPIQEQGGHFEKIKIGQDCWIGNQAVVMASINDKCLVAAGSVVTAPVALGDIVAGNPAKILRNRLEKIENSTIPGN